MPRQGPPGLVLLVWLAGAALGGDPPVSDHPLGLKDEEFWTDPTRTRSDVTHALLDAEKAALVLDAPGRVDLGARATLPAVAILVTEPGEPAALSEVGMLVVVDRRTGLVHAAPAQHRRSPPRPRPAPLPPPPPGQPRPKGDMSGASLEVDLRRLAFPWTARRLVARAVVRSHLSNAVRIELVGAAPPADEKAATPREAGPDQGPAPAIPAAPGLTLAAERVTLLRGPKPEVVLRVAFRARAHTVLRRGPAPPGAPSPTATVRLGIVVADADAALARVTNLEVPSFDVVGPDDPAPVVTGWAALDLIGRGLDADAARSVFVTALCDDLAAGPLPVSTVTPEQLQGE